VGWVGFTTQLMIADLREVGALEAAFVLAVIFATLRVRRFVVREQQEIGCHVGGLRGR